MKNNGRAAPCRKSCCWTPFGTCAKNSGCACHMIQALRDDAAIMAHMGLTIDEVARRRRLRTLKEGPDRKQGGGRWKS